MGFHAIFPALLNWKDKERFVAENVRDVAFPAGHDDVASPSHAIPGNTDYY
jgi:hypothetical protein